MSTAGSKSSVDGDGGLQGVCWDRGGGLGVVVPRAIGRREPELQKATVRGPRRLRVEGDPCGSCHDADKTTWWELTRRTVEAPRSTATT